MTDLQAVIERVLYLDAKRAGTVDERAEFHKAHGAAVMANDAVTLAAECQRLQHIVTSVCAMLGWGNEPPQRTIEMSISALKADRDRLASENAELIANNDTLTLIADGVNHDGRCVRNAVTGCVEGFLCLRCRSEDATAENNILRQRTTLVEEHMDRLAAENATLREERDASDIRERAAYENMIVAIKERDRARQLAREWHRESGICGCDDETGDLCADAKEMATWPTT